MDWSLYVGAFGLGAFPWISQIKSLKIHFRNRTQDFRSVNNVFASVFSISIYLFLGGSLSKSILVNIPEWYVFMIMAAISAIVFFSIYLYCYDRVLNHGIKWPIVVNLILWMSLFANLTFGFGVLRIYTNNTVVKGTIFHDLKERSLSKSKIAVYDLTGTEVASAITNRKGQFVLLVPNDKSPNCRRFEVRTFGFHPALKSIVNVQDLDQLDGMTLKPINSIDTLLQSPSLIKSLNSHN